MSMFFSKNLPHIFERSPRSAAQACFPRYPASSVGIEAHAIIINFDFNKTNLRVIELDDQPWFLLKDVAELLGLKAHPNGGFHHHLVKLDVSEVSHSSELGVKLPGSGMYKAKWVSESGLYKLVMRSDKPEARAFQDWVTKVVLPAIRVSSEGTPCEPCLSTPRYHRSKLLIFTEPPYTM